ncbi:MAG: radical SAM family heme chaperone HemW [Pseudomonadota bacterium]
MTSSTSSEAHSPDPQRLPPVGLYVHLPWCVRKCPYCDFNSHELNDPLDDSQARDYLDLLLADWRMQRTALRDRRVDTIFFGGGTPSLLPPWLFQGLIDEIGPALSPEAEITMEANPGTLEQGDLGGFRDAGVNRLSLGVQSFHQASLEALGRIHSVADATRAIEEAHRVGFTRINLDLMHGLPEQDTAAAARDIERAIDSGVDHVSYYQLTIEPKTAFARRPPELPDEDTLAAIEEDGLAALGAAGFERYEISAYAKAGQACRHNRNYWAFGDYIGIGAGAHGKLTERAAAPESGAAAFHIERTSRPRQPRLYARAVNAGSAPDTQPVPEDQIGVEFLLGALRLLDGVDEDLFATRSGLPLAAIAKPLQDLRRRRLLAPRRLQLTPLGRRFLDSVVAEFLPAG